MVLSPISRVTLPDDWVWNDNDLSGLVVQFIAVRENFVHFINTLDISRPVMDSDEDVILLGLWVYIRTCPPILEDICRACMGHDDLSLQKMRFVGLLLSTYKSIIDKADALKDKITDDLNRYVRSNRLTSGHLKLLVACSGEDLGRMEYMSLNLLAKWFEERPPAGYM